MSGMNALPVAVGLLLAGVPPQAAATRMTATSMPSQRNDLPLMIPPSDVVSLNARDDVRLHHLPGLDRGDAVPVTGFRQAERISVTTSCYRRASWEREGRSLAPREGLLTFSCSSSSGARTASRRASSLRCSTRR